MADLELQRVNDIALMAVQALLGLISSDVVAVAAEREKVLLSFWVRRHTAEIDEDFADAIGNLEAFLYPEIVPIESRVMVSMPDAATTQPHERMIYWAKS
ncbi:hypothetical protein HBK87_07840 [Streptomyces sp. 2BBP-J2]|uniref:hypothetical protein n=1 Tax=unclassified Streptomyces TaxID=2593676 RepID=UPI0014310256|nr:hypothetical protein [Streptomyces sp. 2BBP-J2]NIL50498.1 hypothetical protein [Streptomyces sp. 2BBP-J2]